MFLLADKSKDEKPELQGMTDENDCKESHKAEHNKDIAHVTKQIEETMQAIDGIKEDYLAKKEFALENWTVHEKINKLEQKIDGIRDFLEEKIAETARSIPKEGGYVTQEEFAKSQIIDNPETVAALNQLAQENFIQEQLESRLEKRVVTQETPAGLPFSLSRDEAVEITTFKSSYLYKENSIVKHTVSGVSYIPKIEVIGAYHGESMLVVSVLNQNTNKTREVIVPVTAEYNKIDEITSFVGNDLVFAAGEIPVSIKLKSRKISK